MCDFLNRLSDDMLRAIADNLPVSDQLQLRLASKKFRGITSAQSYKMTGDLYGNLPSPSPEGPYGQRVEELIRALTQRGNKVGLINNDSSITTGRSLLLNKTLDLIDLSTNDQSARDNYCIALGLDSDFFDNIKDKNVLDVGCGSSIFFAEATVIFGAKVDRIDMSLDKISHEHVEKSAARYIEMMSVFVYMDKYCPNLIRTYAGVLDVALSQKILSMAKNKYKLICDYYIKSFKSGFIDCDVSSIPIPESTYDVVLCSWLFMYLDRDKQDAALKEILRVTKVGGLVRILPGDTLAKRVKINKKRLQDIRSGKKRFEIFEAESDKLLKLAVNTSDECSVM